MLDRIENLAETGARDAARQLLSQLQNMLREPAGRPADEGQPAAGEQMMQSARAARRHDPATAATDGRDLRAERGRTSRCDAADPMTHGGTARRRCREPAGGPAGPRSSRSKDLMEQLEALGMEPNGKLGQAGEAMGRAADELGEAGPGRRSATGRGARRPRQGAQAMLASSCASQGPGWRAAIPRRRPVPEQDPLGRPQRTDRPDLGTDVKVPDEIDTQRARRNPRRDPRRASAMPAARS